MANTRLTQKRVGLLSAALVIVLAIWWGNRVVRMEEPPLQDVKVVVPEPPRIGEAVAWKSMSGEKALEPSVKGLERELIEAYGKFNFVPPTSPLLFNAPADFRSDRSGLAEVRRVIQPGSEIEFLGVLSAEEYLYPGRIISITPIARPDYGLPPANLQGLALQPHKVYAAAITSAKREGSGTLPSGADLLDGAKKPLSFNETEIPAGKQDQTGIDYQKFLQQLNGQGGNTSNGHTVFIYKTANTLEEGFQKLGVNASYGAASFIGSTRNEHRADQQHVFIMLKQEFFRVHSDSIGDSPHVLTARLQATQENIVELKKLAEWKRTRKSQIPYQDVPALIKSVTYGRIIILASQDANYSESDLNSFVAEYSSPTASVRVDFENGLRTLLRRSTLKIVTWGGGPLEFQEQGKPKETFEEGTVSTISHEYAAKILSGAAGTNVTWDPKHPGRAIGFAAYYLDQSGTQAHSFSISDKNLLATQGGYPTDARLAFHCRDDHEGFLFFNQTGEWEFKIKTTGDTEEHSFGKFTDINDGDSQPQYRHTHHMAGLSYTQPLTITVSGKEDGDSSWETYPIEFDESKLKPVPVEFDQFSTGPLRDLAKAVSRLSDSFTELRKLGDLHKLPRKNAEASGGEFLTAWHDAQTKVKEVQDKIADIRKQHTTTKEAWSKVKTAIEGHKLSGESPTSPNKFTVELVPRSSATIATVNALLNSLEGAIDGIEEGLK